MPKLTYAENPVHPVLNDYPMALVPASLVFDMLHLVTRRPTFRNAAFFSLLMALVSGGAAAATGYQDYQEIPEGSDAKRMANAHGMLNVGVLGAVALGVLLRMTGRVGLFARFLNLTSGAGLLASSWYGTHLVYRHGLRVRGVDPLAAAPEAMEDTGKPFADQLERFVQAVPATDLSGYAAGAGDVAAKAGEAAATAGRQAQGVLETAGREVAARAEQVRARAQGAGGQDDAAAAGAGAGAGELVDLAATSREPLPDEPGR